MKKILFLSLSILMILCSCESKKVYHPTQFPSGVNKQNFSYAIPYSEKNQSIIVRIRLNNGPQFEGIWDSGCSVPLKISSLEAAVLVNNGTLTASDYIQDLSLTVANGQKNKYNVYMLKSISFVDDKGTEHTLTQIPAVIDDNVETDILIGLPVMQALGDSYEISQYDQLIYFKE